MTFLDNEEGKQELEKLNKVPIKVKIDAKKKVESEEDAKWE